MRGTTFVRPMEFQLNVEGESWSQGQMIKGELVIINHSPDNLLCEELGVELVVGEFKKVKTKDAKAFSSINCKQHHPTQNLPGKGRSQMVFEFPLDINAQITDKTHSLYMRYGNFKTGQLGELQLNIVARPIFQKIAEIADVFLRFKCKDTKFLKGKVILKLIPPETKEYIGLEEMHLTLCSQGDTIQADYTYKQKNLGVDAGVMKINKHTTASAQVWSRQDTFLGQEIPNQNKILSLMQEALEKVKRKDS